MSEQATPPAGQVEAAMRPLWSDGDIHSAMSSELKDNFVVNLWDATRITQRVRDTYEAERQTTQSVLATLMAERDALRDKANGDKHVLAHRQQIITDLMDERKQLRAEVARLVQLTGRKDGEDE